MPAGLSQPFSFLTWWILPEWAAHLPMNDNTNGMTSMRLETQDFLIPGVECPPHQREFIRVCMRQIHCFLGKLIYNVKEVFATGQVLPGSRQVSATGSFWQPQDFCLVQGSSASYRILLPFYRTVLSATGQLCKLRRHLLHATYVSKDHRLLLTHQLQGQSLRDIWMETS